jgi:hypothetical protein
VKSRLELMSRRKTDYEMTFTTEHGRRVLADLAVFGHAFKTTMIDNAASAELEGRRQVFLRIRHYLDLSYDDIAEMIRAEEES